MPPKCGDRNKIKFDKFAGFAIDGKPEKVNNLLARALLNDDYLSQFKGQVNASECIFSYPDSDWYSVYLLDPSGEQYFDLKTGRFKKYYFKLNVNPSRTDATIADATTTTPPELLYPDGVEMENCVITEGGNCGNSPNRRKTTKAVVPKAAKAVTPGTSKKAPKASASSSPEVLSGPGVASSPEEILQRVTQIQTGASSSSGPGKDLPKAKIERSYFENLGSKELIIDWMIKNMDHSDIVKCIQRGSLTPEQVRQAEAVAGMDAGASGSGTGAVLSDAELTFVTEALTGLTTKEAKAALTKVTKGELVAFLKKVTDPGRKAQKIVALCKYAGLKNVKVVEKTRTGKPTIYTIFDNQGEEVAADEINDIINTCAEKEAFRVAKILKLRSISADYKKQTAAQQQLSSKLKGKGPASSVTVESITSQINSLQGKDKKEKIVEICRGVGMNFTIEEKKRTGKSTLYKLMDENNEEIQDDEIDDIVTQCATMIASRSAFGKKKVSKVRSNFKLAAKKCKGKPNYRKCMGRTLRKMYSFGKKLTI